MEVPIACLYPADDAWHARNAILMSENSSRYVPPLEQAALEQGSRESTVSVESDEDLVPNYTKHPGLQLTFSQGPKSGHEFVLGTDSNCCDIVLPKTEDGDFSNRKPRRNKISRRHCGITFDAKRRLILRDFSRHGTTVAYDGQGRETRRHFAWILGGDGASGFEKIVIQIDKMRFQIVVFGQDAYSDLYNDRVDQFLQPNANDELPFGVLGIQSTSSTAQQSGAQTPNLQSHPPIYINQEQVGSGTYSIVNRVWDVSTGSIYACKEVFNMKEKNWREEARILREVSQLSNQHIVRFEDLIEFPSPRFILEYVPLGNLHDQNKKRPFTERESLTILCQSLQALASVHEAHIVHRDIKPENILVKSRDPLHIKLSDFGLSKATSYLKTFCGTHFYAAPEIYDDRRYTNACDIWSLGVVVFKYAYGPLPDFERGDEGHRWCNKIIKHLHDWDSDPLIDLLSTKMLIEDAGKRDSARVCWVQALQLDALYQSRCTTPTQASYITDNNRVADDTEEQQTVENTGSYATVNRYLIGYSTLEQELGDHQSTDEIQLQKKRRTTSTASLLGKRLPVSTRTTRYLPSTVRPPQGQQKNLKIPRSVEPLDLFGQHGLLLPDRREDTDGGSSKLSNWSPFNSAGPVSPSASNAMNGQNSSSSFENTTDRSTLEEYRPSDYRDITISEDFVSVVINGKTVSMRRKDFYLNATQICAAAGLDKPSRDKYLRRLKKRCRVDVVGKRNFNTSSWVPFPDGVFLCQVLKLTQEMQTVFFEAPIEVPSEEENYLLLETPRKAASVPPEYSAFLLHGTEIMYSQALQMVNAAHIFRACHLSRAQLRLSLSSLCIPTTIVKGHIRLQGSWISFKHANELLESLGLRDSPITKLLEPHDHTANQGEPSAQLEVSGRGGTGGQMQCTCQN